MEKYEKYLESLYNHFTPDNPDPIDKFNLAIDYFRKEMMAVRDCFIKLTIYPDEVGEACKIDIYDIIEEETQYDEPIFEAILFADKCMVLS